MILKLVQSAQRGITVRLENTGECLIGLIRLSTNCGTRVSCAGCHLGTERRVFHEERGRHVFGDTAALCGLSRHCVQDDGGLIALGVKILRSDLWGIVTFLGGMVLGSEGCLHIQ